MKLSNALSMVKDKVCGKQRINHRLHLSVHTTNSGATELYIRQTRGTVRKYLH